MIPIESCSISRIDHPSCRFAPGQEVFAVLTGGDRAQQRVTLSHKELLGTWAENAARFAPGMTVPGHIRGIKTYGSFVELAPNKDGMVHISKLSDKRVAKVEDVVNIGDEVTVKVMEIDKMGRVNLSMRPGDLSGKDAGGEEKRERRREGRGER